MFMVGRAELSLKKHFQKSLTTPSILTKNHRHLDVHKMIDNYSSGGSPTLKEISSLISVLHRVVTKVDSDIVSAADPETAFIEALKDGLSNSGNPKERIKEYWGKSLAVRASKLISMSSNYGFRKATDPDHAKKITVSTRRIRI